MKMRIWIVTAFLTFLNIITYGQEKKVLKGIAVDGKRNPIQFISVSIKGTTIAALTDSCGEFSIPIVHETFVLVLQGMSYHDMRTYEIQLKCSDIDNEFRAFQLGYWKLKNPGCKKRVSKKIKKHIIEMHSILRSNIKKFHYFDSIKR